MTTAFKTITVAGKLYRPQGRRRSPLLYLVGWMALCLARRRERLRLHELSEAHLNDLGLTRDDALRESRRWPWDGAER